MTGYKITRLDSASTVDVMSDGFFVELSGGSIDDVIERLTRLDTTVRREATSWLDTTQFVLSTSEEMTFSTAWWLANEASDAVAALEPILSVQRSRPIARVTLDQGALLGDHRREHSDWHVDELAVGAADDVRLAIFGTLAAATSEAQYFSGREHDGHGPAVASVVRSLARGVTIEHVGVTPSVSLPPPERELAAALATTQADVVLLSIPAISGGLTRAAVRAARERGVIIVAAAGVFDTWPLEHVITAGASDESGQPWRNVDADVMAPGVGLPVEKYRRTPRADGRFDSLRFDSLPFVGSGTGAEYAAACVAALAARFLHKRKPELVARDIDGARVHETFAALVDQLGLTPELQTEPLPNVHDPYAPGNLDFAVPEFGVLFEMSARGLHQDVTGFAGALDERPGLGDGGSESAAVRLGSLFGRLRGDEGGSDEPSTPLINAGHLEGVVVDGAANYAGTGPSTFGGAGVVVGIVDGHVDISHPSIRGRVVAVWDQTAKTAVVDRHERDVPFGVAYSTEAELKTYLDGLSDLHVRHGTHVASLAAGSETDTFLGSYACHSKIAVVVGDFGGQHGYGTCCLAAMQWLDSVAGERPLVVNLSHGTNHGARDGRAILERAIDVLSSSAGRVIVKSAGNEGGQGRHLHKRFRGTCDLEWTSRVQQRDADRLQAWVRGSPVRASLTREGNELLHGVDPDGEPKVVVNGTVRVELRNHRSTRLNGHAMVEVLVEYDTTHIYAAPETWTLTLTPLHPLKLDVDAWFERPLHESTPVCFVDAQDERTLTVPGTSRDVISVAGITVDHTPMPTSSRGPAFPEQQPTVAAIADSVLGARGLVPTAPLCAMRGTSHAAPQVTAMIAEVFAEQLALAGGERSGVSNGTQMRIAVTTAALSTSQLDHWDPELGNGWLRLDALREVLGLPPQAGA